jgi:hypothetical protein
MNSNQLLRKTHSIPSSEYILPIHSCSGSSLYLGFICMRVHLWKSIGYWITYESVCICIYVYASQINKS